VGDEGTRVDAREHLASLVGRTILTIGQQRGNRILRIEGHSVVVATQRSPDGQTVPIAWVQDALDRLLRDGEVLVSVKSVGYRSAFIGAVLATVPDTEVLTRPRRDRLRTREATRGS